MLQAEQRENKESQREKETLQAMVQHSTFPGGRHRSADHPNRIDNGYKTMSAWQLEERTACWGHISLEQLEASIEARKQPGMTSPPRLGHWFLRALRSI